MMHQHYHPHHNLNTINPHLFSQQQNFHHQSCSQNSQSSGSQTMPFLQHMNQHQHHHLYQQQQQQQQLYQQNQNQYSTTTTANSINGGVGGGAGGGSVGNNANSNNSNNNNNNSSSDYSSSTYHVYDQILGDQMIDDLIVIKQERMKKKLEQEHRRKVILFGCALILLVGLLMFLLLQLFKVTSSGLNDNNNNNNLLLLSRSQNVASSRTSLAGFSTTPFSNGGWPAPPGGSPPTANQAYQDRGKIDFFDSSTMKTFPSIQQAAAASHPTSAILHHHNSHPHKQQPPCSNHGQLVIHPESRLQVCRCEVGFYGAQCEQVMRCTQIGANFCQNNGQCDRISGRCLCPVGYFGVQCEQSTSIQADTPIPAHQQPVDLNQVNVICAQMLNNCNGNGQCLPHLSRCKCRPGFAGDSCQIKLDNLCLPSQTCSNQGHCLPETGLCQCKLGFYGPNCEYSHQQHQLINCSSHGQYDFVIRKCNCDSGYTGSDCSEILVLGGNNQQDLNENKSSSPVVDCDNNLDTNQTISSSIKINCGPYGSYSCQERRCICQDGYTGDLCHQAKCSPRCIRNGGQCLPDSQCTCPTGRYGRYCSYDGCPNNCSGRGLCVRPAGGEYLLGGQQEWRCQCQPGAMGEDCSQLSERQCDDGIDNDGDGLVDCADSECCSDKSCQNSTLCMKSPDPLDILMKKQKKPESSTFFQRMQFLIDKSSSQTYSNPKDFNESRASVIRGRVTYLKQGLTGVRVQVAGQRTLGITLTRDNGYFDLMVNGGGAVVVEFIREPFATLQKTVRVPWNEIVLIDNIELQLENQQVTNNNNNEQDGIQQDQPEDGICSAHNYLLMKPQIIATGSKLKKRSNSRQQQQQQQQATNSKLQMNSSNNNKLLKTVILRDSSMVQQTIVLPNSPTEQQQQAPVSLVYISSKSDEFKSQILVQLTPIINQAQRSSNNQLLPDDLKLIHLKIVIEGTMFKQTFEPQQNLTFTYAWNRRNVYKQKSFGLSTAMVSIGYEYFDCQRIVWTSKQLQLPGHDLSISDIGNQWNLNIHHRYNYLDAILQRGDGQNFNMRSELPLVVHTQMGDGYQRAPMCPYCDGQSAQPAEHRLLKPEALVSAPDNSLYVGDQNLIRKMEATPTSGGERLVRTIIELPMPSNNNNNNNQARQQQASYSLALNPSDSRLYLADLERFQVFYIREKDANNLLYPPLDANETNQATAATTTTQTSLDSNVAASLLDNNLVPVVGQASTRCQYDENNNSADNCGDSGPARLARLIEPKSIAFDLANRMYLADGPNVRVVEPKDQKIYTLLGDYSGRHRQFRFPCSPGDSVPMHRFAPKSPNYLAVSPIDDSLHFLDENVVYKITQNKQVQHVAGRLQHCNHHHQQQDSNNKLKASEFAFQSARSIAFLPNGNLFVADEDPNQQFSARVYLVDLDEDSISLHVGMSPTQQIVSRQQEDVSEQKSRLSNLLPTSQVGRASEHKFAFIGAIAVDQRGNLLVADKQQPRVVSIEPDLPQMNAAGEYELQAPDNLDELLIFNRFGHQIGTRDLTSSQNTLASTLGLVNGDGGGGNSKNKYTFTYNVNTSFGQLVSIAFANGHKLSIQRDASHQVKTIESSFGGQCKLDISRGQLHAISVNSQQTKINFTYNPVESGLLRQSSLINGQQQQAESYDLVYDEFGRAQSITLSSQRHPTGPIECKVQHFSLYSSRHQQESIYLRECSALIVE